jgi:hypothetical protein
MIRTSPGVCLAVVLAACSRTGPLPPHEAAVARADVDAYCGAKVEPELRHRIATTDGPFRVSIDFLRPPLQSVWLATGIADCLGASCVGVVTRDRVLSLCDDVNVRRLQAFD